MYAVDVDDGRGTTLTRVSECWAIRKSEKGGWWKWWDEFCRYLFGQRCLLSGSCFAAPQINEFTFCANVTQRFLIPAEMDSWSISIRCPPLYSHGIWCVCQYLPWPSRLDSRRFCHHDTPCNRKNKHRSSEVKYSLCKKVKQTLIRKHLTNSAVDTYDIGV